MEKKLSDRPWISEHCNIENSTLGNFTEIGLYNFFENVMFGDYSYTGQFCFLQNVEIGKFSNIAAMVRIGPTDHPMERPTQHHFTYRRKMYGFGASDDLAFMEARKERVTVVGHDTWIGHGAIILSGVTIGNGAVIGAGSLVTKDVAPYAVVVGLPGRAIKKRFDEEIILKLEAIQWWNWSHEKINENFEDFLSDAKTFVEKHY